MSSAIERPVFTAIQFQTMDYCNRRCSFCPNVDDIRKTNAVMSDKILQKILADLENIGFMGRVSPYLFNEPLLDPKIFSVVSSIREKLPENIIFINSNGDPLCNNNLRESLANSEIDGIHINCYGGEKLYLKILKLIRQMAYEYPRVRIRNSGSLRLLKQRDGFLNIKVIWIPTAKSNFWNRGGNVNCVVPIKKGVEKFVCEYPFEQLYLNHFGDAILCCSDWRFTVRMGNIMQSSILDIWNGPLYQHYRKMHLRLRAKELPLCATCNLISYPPPSTISHE